MITAKGYKEVDYNSFKGILYNAFKRSKKTYFQLAVELKVNSTQTTANALNCIEQKVSDKVLTSLMDYVGVKGFITWVSGKRYYYIKNNQ